MKLFNAILGVFAAFAAMFCFLYPGRTFLNAGWMVTFLLVCWGACALFETATEKGNAKPTKDITARGVLALVAGIATGTASVLAIFNPKFVLATDMLIILVFLFWIFVSGITAIVRSIIMKKKMGGKKWIFVLLLGILTILAGFYGVYHVFLTAWAVTWMFGVVLMGYGVRLLASVFE